MADTYYFHPDGNGLKQGFLMEDGNDTLVYEAKCLKMSLFGPALFEFTNHRTGRSEEHKIGHTITTEHSGPLTVEILSTKSHFKFDGRKIWDYLHVQGVRIDSHLSGGSLGMTYRVSLRGTEIATIATASGKNSKFPLTTRYAQHVTCEESDLDLVFLTAFAIARTEQTFYN